MSIFTTMGTVELQSFWERPCRFKLRGGKEIYGVIWSEKSEEGLHYYFTSSCAYRNFVRKKDELPVHLRETDLYPVDINDIIAAEYLEAG